MYTSTSRLQTIQAPSLSVANQNSFRLTYYFSLYVEKLFPSSAAAPSMCHQTFLTVARSVKIYYFLWPGPIGSVTNWSQPVLYGKKKKKKKQFISLLSGPWHKYYFRPNRSTRCFLPELQNEQHLWDTRESCFLCMNWSCVRTSKMRGRSQDEKVSYLCLDLEKRFQYLQLKLCLLGKRRETNSNFDT